MKRTYIQNRSVNTAGRSIRPKLSGSTAGIKSVSVFVVHPTDWTSVAQDLFFLGGSGHRAVAHIHLATPKMFWALLACL